MRTQMRMLGVLSGAVVLVLAMAGPAGAKGVSQGEITGAGIDKPIVLGPGTGGDVERVAEDLGAFAAAFRQEPNPMLAESPTDDLGPKLTITWTVPDGEGKPATITQDLYLYAADGPLTFTAEQALWPGQDVLSGWFRADDDVVATLVGLGVPDRSTLEAAGPARVDAAAAGARSSSGGDSGRPWLLVPVGAILAVVTIVGTRALAGRRRRAHAQAIT